MPYHVGQKRCDLEREEVTKQIRAGVIKLSSTEWACPVVLAQKKDEILCFCVNYHCLNTMTVRDDYPILRMDKCIVTLCIAVLFTTLDANSGYWQCEVGEADPAKTTFPFFIGLFHYVRMPFGLRTLLLYFKER